MVLVWESGQPDAGSTETADTGCQCKPSHAAGDVSDGAFVQVQVCDKQQRGGDAQHVSDVEIGRKPIEQAQAVQPGTVLLQHLMESQCKKGQYHDTVQPHDIPSVQYIVGIQGIGGGEQQTGPPETP